MSEFIRGILKHLHDVDPYQMIYWMLVGALFHSVIRTPTARADRDMHFVESRHDRHGNGEVRTSHRNSTTKGNARRDTRRRHV